MQSDQISSVKAGVFVIISVMIVIVGIVALGQRTQLLRPKYPLRTEFRNVGGLIPGADVRVAGVTAGTVGSVEVVTAPGQPAVVQVVLNVGTEYRDKIRADARVSCRTLGPLGDKYVEIYAGEASELLSGDHIQAEEPVDFYAIAEQARETLERANRIAAEVADTLAQVDKAAVIRDLSAGATSLRKVLGAVESGPGLAHTLIFDPELPKVVEDLRVTAAALRASAERVGAGQGALGQLIHGEKLGAVMGDVADLCVSAKAILLEIEKGGGAAHAVIYEPDLRQTLSELGEAVRRLNAVLSQVEKGEGTLGLLITDPAVWESLTRLLGGAEESRVLKLLVRRAVGD